MRAMIDTNIFIDVLMEREPYYGASRAVLNLCESRKIQGFLPVSAVAGLFYLLRRHGQSKESAYKALGDVLDIVKVLTVTNQDVLDAYMQKASDFEDCLLAVCAKANKCEAIVTRNTQDFQSFGVAILSPEEVEEKYLCY